MLSQDAIWNEVRAFNLEFGDWLLEYKGYKFYEEYILSLK